MNTLSRKSLIDAIMQKERPDKGFDSLYLDGCKQLILSSQKKNTNNANSPYGEGSSDRLRASRQNLVDELKDIDEYVLEEKIRKQEDRLSPFKKFAFRNKDVYYK